MKAAKENLRLQKILVLVAITLFIVKLVAWFLTGSLAILTDALESIVNIVAGILGLYSLTLSSKPKDADHPYGHGKVEFLSAGVEGSLIVIAGFYIIYKAVESFFIPHTIQKIKYGDHINCSNCCNKLFDWKIVHFHRKKKQFFTIGGRWKTSCE